MAEVRAATDEEASRTKRLAGQILTLLEASDSTRNDDLSALVIVAATCIASSIREGSCSASFREVAEIFHAAIVTVGESYLAERPLAEEVH